MEKYFNTIITVFCCIIAINYGFAQTQRVSTPLFTYKDVIRYSHKLPFIIRNKNGQLLELSTAALQEIYVGEPQLLTLDLPYNSTIITVNLQRVEMLDAKFGLVAETGNHQTQNIAYEKGVYYRGTIAGSTASFATLSVFPDEVMGVFTNSQFSFNLGELPNAEDYNTWDEKVKPNTRIYTINENESVEAKRKVDCYTDDTQPDIFAVPSAVTTNYTAARTLNMPDTVRIYIECSYALYNELGQNISRVGNYVTNVFNSVAMLYANENIVLTLAPVHIWTTNDPYDANAPLKQSLALFHDYRTTFDGDQAILLSNGYRGGYSMGINTLCTDLNYLCISVPPVVAALPNYSSVVNATAHELGHALGSHHTNWCGWVGGPIDGCVPTESSVNSAPCTTDIIPVGGGTIMSMCQQTSGGVNFSKGFGLQPGNRIRYCIANRFCAANSTVGGVSARFVGLQNEQSAWRLDSGAWRQGGDVISDVAAGTHVVSFATVVGITPAPQTITVVARQNKIVIGVYEPLARVTAMISGGNGKGRWHYSGYNPTLTPTDTLPLQLFETKYIVFKPVAGWYTPPPQLITALTVGQIVTANGVYTPRQTAALTVNLAGATAAKAWSVDNETWYNSGDMIMINTNNNYTLYYRTVAGWLVPPTTVVSSSSATLITVNAAYTIKPLTTVKVAFTGGNGAGRWSINNGVTWRNSGDTAMVLQEPNSSFANYRIVFKSVANWAAPLEIPTIGLQINNINTYNVAYTRANYATVKLNLTGGNNNGRWGIDGQPRTHLSGDIIQLRTDSVHYFYTTNVPNWLTPQVLIYAPTSADTVGTQVLTAVYQPVVFAYLRSNFGGSAGLGGWRIDPANAVWQRSGDSLLLPTQQYYTVQYRNAADWISPSTTNLLLTANTALTNDNYTPIEYGNVTATILGGNNQGRWSVDDGINWYNSGQVVSLVTNANYTISYKGVSGFNTPQNVAFMGSDLTTLQLTNFTANYTPAAYTTLKVNLANDNGQGYWTSDEGAHFRQSGDTVMVRNNKDYTVFCSPVVGKVRPNGTFIPQASLVANTTIIFNQTYLDALYGTIKVNLTGANGLGQWSIDEGIIWRNSGDSISVLTDGYYTIQYKPVANWNMPRNTIFSINNLSSNHTNVVLGAYTSPQYEIFEVDIISGDGLGQWTLNNGITWRNSGDTVMLNSVANYDYVVQFKNIAGWRTPSYIIISPSTLEHNTTTIAFGEYYLPSYTPIQMTLTGANQGGRWRVDAQTKWHSSGDTALLSVYNVHDIYFSKVNGWDSPLAFNLNPFTPADTAIVPFTAAYTAIEYGALQVNIAGGNGNGKWTIDGGIAWRNSGDTAMLRIDQPYSISYKNANNWLSPNTDMVNVGDLSALMPLVRAGVYTPLTYSTLRVNIVGSNGQGLWRINGMAWRNGGDSIVLPANTSYQIQYRNVNTWVTPSDDAVTLSDLAAPSIIRTGIYRNVEYAALQVNITGGGSAGQWSINNGATWRNSADTALLRTDIGYSMSYRDVPMWTTPGFDFVNAGELTAGDTLVRTGIYTPSEYGVLLVDIVGGGGLGKWSLDFGMTWRNVGDTLMLRNDGSYTIIYQDVSGWLTPSSDAIAVGELSAASPLVRIGVYTAIDYGTLRVNLVGANGKGQWSINGINWRNSGDSVLLNVFDTPSILYKNITGWLSPNADAVNSSELAVGTPLIKTGVYTLLTATAAVSPEAAVVSIYPNPTHEKVSIQLSVAPQQQPITIAIYNAVGVRVYATQVTQTTSEQTVTIGVAQLPAGVYFVAIALQNGVVTRKLIVTKL